MKVQHIGPKIAAIAAFVILSLAVFALLLKMAGVQLPLEHHYTLTATAARRAAAREQRRRAQQRREGRAGRRHREPRHAGAGEDAARRQGAPDLSRRARPDPHEDARRRELHRRDARHAPRGADAQRGDAAGFAHGRGRPARRHPQRARPCHAPLDPADRSLPGRRPRQARRRPQHVAGGAAARVRRRRAPDGRPADPARAARRARRRRRHGHAGVRRAHAGRCAPSRSSCAGPPMRRRPATTRSARRCASWRPRSIRHAAASPASAGCRRSRRRWSRTSRARRRTSGRRCATSPRRRARRARW